MNNRPCILLVDDEDDILEGMSRRLDRRGYAVEKARCCADAMQAMQRTHIDVVILDVMLQDQSGIDCLREIKKECAGAAVILLTGHASIQAGIESLDLGASDYCLKPISMDELVDKIEIAHRDNKAL